MSTNLIHLQREGTVATLILHREAKRHALTPAMLDQLEVELRRLEADTSVRVVILTATGTQAFCVGADINEWAALAPLDMWRRWVKRGHQVFDQLARLRQPVIAALNGHAFGGGLELALTADIRLASDTALFAMPEASISTCPGWSGSQRMVRLIGASQVKYLALSGQRVTAAQAHQIGLVHEVLAADALLARARALAQEMAGQAPIALQLSKQLVNAASGEDQAQSLEAMAGALAALTEDAAEGIKSFQEKRRPSYSGH